MSAYLHFLHHLWADPLSARDKFDAYVLVTLPLILAGTALYGAWQWIWQKYNDEI